VFVGGGRVPSFAARGEKLMRQLNWLSPFLLWLAFACGALAQTYQPNQRVTAVQTGTAAPQQQASDKGASGLDAEREKQALRILLKIVDKAIVSAANAMPADKYGFAPTDGEFKGVRTFGQQVKHLAATNHILAAAALGQEPPADAGDETGPEAARTKAEILDYLSASFAHLGKAIDAIGEPNPVVRASPISPLKSTEATRSALVVESLVHAFDHYGQMVEYLRMNGVVPPASRP
jgi:uncharacterized damage-inducible protein DinB